MIMKEIKITWVGCHSEGELAFRSLLEKGHKVTNFITLNDESFSKRSGASRGYIELCQRYGINVSLISTIKDEESYQIIKAAEPDVLIVLGWSEILPERLLDIPTIGTVGAHAAMLPHNRGSAPINWALIKDEKTCGNSFMWLSKNVDAGKIIDQIPFEITDYDTCKTLYDKVAETNEKMLLRLIDRLSAGLPTVMEKENVTDEEILPRRRPKDGLIDWNTDARAVYNFIRALTRPYPGAFTYLNGTKYLLWSAALLPTAAKVGDAGEILGSVYSPIDDACGIQIVCGTGSVIVHEIEDESGNIYKGRELSSLKLKGRFTNE